MNYGYNYNPDPQILHPEEYSRKVWTEEPELRTYVMPKCYAWVIGAFYEEYSDFDPTPRETNWHRWTTSRSHRSYSRSTNLYRQLIAATHPNDAEDCFQGLSLRLSWQQAMDIEFVINLIVRTMRGNNPNEHTLDFYPLTLVESGKMPSADELLWEKQRLNLECISQFRFMLPLEPAGTGARGTPPDDMDEGVREMYETFREHLKRDAEGAGSAYNGP